MEKDEAREINEPNPISEEQATEQLKKGYHKAEETIKDPDKLEALLKRAESMLKDMQGKGLKQIGEALSYIPTLISMIQAYIKGTYREIPVGSIIAVVSALIYLVSPIDLIPDVFPVVGHLDDAAVIMACLKLIQKDLDAYITFRDNQTLEADNA